MRFDDGSRGLYATDASNYRQVPIGVVIPRDAIETVAACRRYGVPILARVEPGTILVLPSEFLESKDYPPPELRSKAVVHVHCHHKAVMGSDHDQMVLSKLGLDFEILDSGCCGMA